ncbi:hypothetical protein N825_13250 [Skermanella stibiiresistens SB22]|uniref:Uncharacterized protein n=1 Tax=Skermanella stibiiresistens SB22 TaxID=1385369 RepID=W9GXB1_9PROT|nr:hypothetical protein [Skermanella stibiiresistens]EWY38449.1 hypothetical protein N825_13250 [Skermanella stibiiresistens SB22]
MGADLGAGREASDRFVIQRAVGKKWETVEVHGDAAGGAAAFAASVRAAPRSFLRLIRLRADPNARGEVYDWTLVSLHDPRRDAPPPRPSGQHPSGRKPGKTKGAEPVRAPVKLYVLLFLAGAALVLLWLLAGGRSR